MPVLYWAVEPRDSGQRVGQVVRRRLGVSRTLLQRARRQTGILLNGKAVFMNAIVAAGDEIAVRWREDAPAYAAEPLPLDVLYEDEWLIAINKPPGQLVHPARREQTGTVLNALAWRWRQSDSVPRPVHRLDRNTSGALLIARNAHTQRLLARQWQRGQLARAYLAIVAGSVPENSAELTWPLEREPGHPVRRRVAAQAAGGAAAAAAAAVTKVIVLRRYPQATLLAVQLVTGRTHQIRAHLSHWGYPLLGDDLYGGDNRLIARQALHAVGLRFRHPHTGHAVTVKAPLPPDLRRLLRRLARSTEESRRR